MAQKTLSFLSKKFVTRTIGDRSVKFYSCNASSLFALKEIVEPIAKGLVALFSANPNDVEITNQLQKDEKDGTLFTQDKSTAIDPELAKFRATQKITAITDILRGLGENVTKIVLAKLLMSSMRDEGFEKDPDDHVALAFFNETDLDSLGEMVSGLIEINKKMFAPFLNRLPEKVKAALRGVEDLASATEPATTSVPETTG